MARCNLRLPVNILAESTLLAHQRGISLDEFLIQALAEKVAKLNRAENGRNDWANLYAAPLQQMAEKIQVSDLGELSEEERRSLEFGRRQM